MDCGKEIEQFFSNKKVKGFDQYDLDASGKFKKTRESSSN